MRLHSPWPADPDDSFIVSTGGLLGNHYLQMTVVTALCLGALLKLRKLRS